MQSGAISKPAAPPPPAQLGPGTESNIRAVQSINNRDTPARSEAALQHGLVALRHGEGGVRLGEQDGVNPDLEGVGHQAGLQGRDLAHPLACTQTVRIMYM